MTDRAASKVILTNAGKFFAHRGFSINYMPLLPEGETNPDSQRAQQLLIKFGSFRIDAVSVDGTRAQSLLVITGESPLARTGPKLQDSISRIIGDSRLKGTLDEVLVVMPPSITKKSNIADAVENVARSTGVLVTLVPYDFLIADMPRHAGIALHETMSAEEVAALEESERIDKSELPKVYTLDVPIVWVGARVGDVVRITRTSASSGKSVSYRRVVATPRK